MIATSLNDRHATMQYIRADSSMNRRYMAAGSEISTGKYETRDVFVHDARPEISKYTIETTGFEMVRHHSKVQNWSNMKELETTYSDEIHDLVKEQTGADEVIIFAPVRRTTQSRKTDENASWDEQPPASDVHVDYTSKRAECLARDFAQKNGLDVNSYSRVKFINLWRAVSPGPQNWPLAFCRGDVVKDEEGIINHLVYVDEIPDMNNLPAELPHDPMYPEGSLFTYQPSHHWVYYSNMSKDEVVLFVLYDSKLQQPWRVPHCAFENNMEGTVPRESVEIRAVCFFK